MYRSQVSLWRATPQVVFVLIGAIVAAQLLFALASPALQQSVLYAFAMIPARYEAGGPMPFRSWLEAAAPLFGHVFLHAGVLHLIVNVLVLAQVGPLVAWRLGAERFLLLFFASGAAGALAYALLAPGSETAMVGASGAISGVFGAYFIGVRPTPRQALADPRVRNAIGVFLLVNVALAAAAQMSGFLPIAWQAHLGGFAAGIALFPLFSPPRARPRWR